jgi:hypothetical protein
MVLFLDNPIFEAAAEVQKNFLNTSAYIVFCRILRPAEVLLSCVRETSQRFLRKMELAYNSALAHIAAR